MANPARRPPTPPSRRAPGPRSQNARTLPAIRSDLEAIPRLSRATIEGILNAIAFYGWHRARERADAASARAAQRRHRHTVAGLAHQADALIATVTRFRAQNTGSAYRWADAFLSAAWPFAHACRSEVSASLARDGRPINETRRDFEDFLADCLATAGHQITSNPDGILGRVLMTITLPDQRAGGASDVSKRLLRFARQRRK